MTKKIISVLFLVTCCFGVFFNIYWDVCLMPKISISFFPLNINALPMDILEIHSNATVSYFPAGAMLMNILVMKMALLACKI